MSKWMMTNLITKKLKICSIALTLTLAVTISFNADNFNNQSTSVTTCIGIDLPTLTNHNNFQCHASYKANKSWLSWLANDSKSAHLHFLDLVELLHYSFH
jgi:hypothetical protein